MLTYGLLFFSLDLQDIVTGAVERAVVFNYLIELDWLVGQCPGLKSLQQLVLLHGESPQSDIEFKALGIQNLRVHRPPLPLP